jgi:molybdopterin-synthase adenylyltransferase
MIAADAASGMSDGAWSMKLPRVKPEHAPYRKPDGRIHVGGQCFGVAAEIADPTGSVWTLILAMDGSRGSDEIVEHVTQRHPGESPEAVQAAITALIESGYVEDCGAPDPPELSEREKERYDRSRSYLSFVDLAPRSSPWEPQARLRRARVTVAGLGGVGCSAALALAASGVGEIHCVDCDVVELSNLSRQILFTEGDIGRPKTVAGVERLRQLNSDITVSGEQARISGVADVVALAEDCDVLALCADHPAEIQGWTNRACLQTKTPWVDVAYHGALVAGTTYVPGQGPCWQCLHIAQHGDDPPPSPTTGYAYGPPLGNVVLAPSAGIAGHLAAHAVMALLTDSQQLVPGRIYSVNLLSPDASFAFEAPRLPDCPDCGQPAEPTPDGGDRQRPTARPANTRRR